MASQPPLLVRVAQTLAALLSVSALALSQTRPREAVSRLRPNVLVIVLDQVSQKAVGAYGNTWARTPHIDRLASRGTRVSNVYVTTPLCVPSRASLWTSRLPHETGLVSNAPELRLTADLPTLGSAFGAAGYEAVHFGKEHDGGTLRGFRRVPAGRIGAAEPALEPISESASRDRDTAERAAAFLRGPHARPFLVVADLINPHDICGWVGRHQGDPSAGALEERELPPLPDNFEILELAQRPLPIQYLCCSHRRLAQAARWSPSLYRRYLAAYRDYLERADAEVGRLLNALEASPAARDTIVVLLADHGDGLAAHRHVADAAHEALQVHPILGGRRRRALRPARRPRRAADLGRGSRPRSRLARAPAMARARIDGHRRSLSAARGEGGAALAFASRRLCASPRPLVAGRGAGGRSLTRLMKVACAARRS